MGITAVCEGFGTERACGKCELELDTINIGMLTRQNISKILKNFVTDSKKTELLSLFFCYVNCNCEIIDTCNQGFLPTVHNMSIFFRSMVGFWARIQEQMYINEHNEGIKFDIGECTTFLERIKNYKTVDDMYAGLLQLGGRLYGRTYIEDPVRAANAARYIDSNDKWPTDIDGVEFME